MPQARPTVMTRRPVSWHTGWPRSSRRNCLSRDGTMGNHQEGVHTAVNRGQQTSTADQYSVDIQDTTDKTGQIRNRANTSYDREHDGGFWDWLQKVLFKGSTVDGQVRNETSQDAATLGQGVTMRP